MSQVFCFHKQHQQPASVEKDLKCRWIGGRSNGGGGDTSSRHHPYFILRRLKLEEHSLSPYIVAVHDFMSEAEAQVFKSLAVDRLQRSAHGGKRAFGITSDKRTSKQYKT